MRTIRQPTEDELRMLEAQRDAFCEELDALVRRYAMTEDNLAFYLAFPGVSSATIFTDLKPDDQRGFLSAVLGGVMDFPGEAH